MPAEAPNASALETSSRFLELSSLILSIYVMGALACQTFLPLPPQLQGLLGSIDTLVCFFFLFEFFYRLWRAENRWSFLAWNWIDFVASIPAIEVFRWGRIFRILRILRAIRSTRVLIRYLFRNRKDATLKSVLLISFVLLIFSSVAVLTFEDLPESNIKTPADALWWAFVSLTTVGYGDKYPITPGGRIIAALLVTAGVGLFGTLSGYIASYFIEPEQQSQESEIRALTTEVRTLHAKLDHLEQLLANNVNQSQSPN